MYKDNNGQNTDDALIMYMIEMGCKEPTKEQMIQYTSKWINLWFKKKVS